MNVLVCGSRSWDDTDAIRHRLQRLPRGSVVISGAARGADKMAATVARSLGLEVEEHPAHWDTEGRRAGILRNLRMLDRGPALVIAFWDGRSTGTAHTLTEARRRGIPVEVVSP